MAFININIRHEHHHHHEARDAVQAEASAPPNEFEAAEAKRRARHDFEASLARTSLALAVSLTAGLVVAGWLSQVPLAVAVGTAVLTGLWVAEGWWEMRRRRRFDTRR